MSEQFLQSQVIFHACLSQKFLLGLFLILLITRDVSSDFRCGPFNLSVFIISPHREDHRSCYDYSYTWSKYSKPARVPDRYVLVSAGLFIVSCPIADYFNSSFDKLSLHSHVIRGHACHSVELCISGEERFISKLFCSSSSDRVK